MGKTIFNTIITDPEQAVFSESNRYRTVFQLEKGWKFRKGDPETGIASDIIFNDEDWNTVAVPHDWAVAGPFDENNDRQNVAILQNTEELPSIKTGRTGGLPHTGCGWYRFNFRTGSLPPDDRRVLIQFDGAMSNAVVYINGEEAGRRPYGYSYFYFDITDLIKKGENLIAVRLENAEQASRWYPGAGLYRNVRLIEKPSDGFKVWGTFITTPEVSDEEALIRIQSEVSGKGLELRTEISCSGNSLTASSVSVKSQLTADNIHEIICDKNYRAEPDKRINAEQQSAKNIRETQGTGTILKTLEKNGGAFSKSLNKGKENSYDEKLSNERDSAAQKQERIIEQLLKVSSPSLWSPENPVLYKAVLSLIKNGHEIDRQEIRFGIRSIKYSSEKGFELNGSVRKFKGVCLHHDLGPLGAAVNNSAIRRQLSILKDMGCDSIRSSHNMPAPEMLDMCDEMGFMFMAESFDEWKTAKMKNGYNLLFDEWAEKDIINLTGRVRNHPSVVMYSCGNEIPDQLTPEGKKLLKYLQDIFHREDPTRPVTVGMDQVESVMNSGFGSEAELPGLNYRVHLYKEAYEKFPQKIILGSETASTVSSRGIYKFPAQEGKMVKHDDLQCSSYDLEACSWSNIPDEDFALSDDNPWLIGQFVWTGFDYLGEPTPYDDEWPSRSSYFGICDLAGIPKDRYYLYRSVWNTESPTLHILPHWNWKERKGLITPVFIYTNYDSAELFINGKSQGIRKKNKDSKLGRYRLIWMETIYEAGELKAVAYDRNGNPAMEKAVYTSDEAASLQLEAEKAVIKGNGRDISYITVSAADRKGNFCPLADNTVSFNVRGAGTFKAACNGDATSLELFHKPAMKLFSGRLVVLVQSKKEDGEIILEAESQGLKSASVKIKAEK